MLLTIYTILGLFVLAFIIAQVVFDNTFSRKQIYICLIFPVHMLVAVLVCFISYTVFFYIDNKKHLQNKDK